jgi:hypothetical protein
LRTAPRTKRSLLATESLPMTGAKAVCPASCGTGLKPLALLQTCVTSTLRDPVTKHLHAWIISSTPAPSAGVVRTSTILPPTTPPTRRILLQIPCEEGFHHALHHCRCHTGCRLC